MAYSGQRPASKSKKYVARGLCSLQAMGLEVLEVLEEEYGVRCIVEMAVVALAASGDSCGDEGERLEQGDVPARSRGRWEPARLSICARRRIREVHN